MAKSQELNFVNEIAGFFRDPEGSSIVSLAMQQIASPVVRGQDLQPDELGMGGGLRVVMYVLDASPSMSAVGDMLCTDFNNELVPAIQEAREDDISALRIGGVAFSDRVTPIWVKGKVAFHKLAELPKLTKAEYDPSVGFSTALNQAILEATALGMKYCADIERDVGIQPDLDVVILSDGANNCPPMDNKVVRTVIDGRDKNRVRYVYFFFQTSQGLDKPEDYAKEIGIDGENVVVFAAKPGENAQDRRKRFRRMMRVMSRVSASKGTSAVQASAVPPAPADEDLV